MNFHIGVLYPGGLGAVFGRAIAQSGLVPLTCVSGRSEITIKRAAEAGFVVMPSLQDLVSNCDLLLSLVVPAAAVKVAEDVAYAASAAGGACTGIRKLLFVDANSVGPCTKDRIGTILSSANIRYAGAAYFGPINCVGHDNVLALSGTAASEVARLLKPIVQVQIVGTRIGDASELKMSMAIITKALPALFLEMACASANRGHLDSSLALMKRLYPGIFSFIERTLPTYPSRLERRLQELDEVAHWLAQHRQESGMVQCARAIFQRLSSRNLGRQKDWRLEDLLSEITADNLLADS